MLRCRNYFGQMVYIRLEWLPQSCGSADGLCSLWRLSLLLLKSEDCIKYKGKSPLSLHLMDMMSTRKMTQIYLHFIPLTIVQPAVKPRLNINLMMLLWGSRGYNKSSSKCWVFTAHTCLHSCTSSSTCGLTFLSLMDRIRHQETFLRWKDYSTGAQITSPEWNEAFAWQPR